jgi:two-component system sensor histidine kinase UhpB
MASTRQEAQRFRPVTLPRVAETTVFNREPAGADSMGAELHDRVISGLTALLLEMEQFKREQYNRSSVQSAVTAFQDSMRTTLGALREIVHELVGGPHELDRGLIEAVQTGPLAELRTRTGATTRVIVSPRWPDKLSPMMAMQLYRIVEQALRNVADHAGAHNVNIEFAVSDHRLVVKISDDGVGLPPGPRVDGQGTRGMRQRALLLGGSVEIRGRRPAGVMVACAVPLPAGA